MRWKTKAMVHRIVARLPESVGERVNYALQRRFGRLRTADTGFEHIAAGFDYARRFADAGYPLHDRTVLEIGTGRHVLFAISLWLCGARRIDTVDVNRYFRPDITFVNIAAIAQHREHIVALAGTLGTDPQFLQRLDQLCALPPDAERLFALTNIRYHAPIDTRTLPFADGSIDRVVSYNVFEFIAPSILTAVVRESLRVTAADGAHLHVIDLTDWFAASDRSISRINFLQFDEKEWLALAGNQYMYHNRFRVDDYRSLFTDSGSRILSEMMEPDSHAEQLIRSGFPLAAPFTSKTPEINAASCARFIIVPSAPNAGGTVR